MRRIILTLVAMSLLGNVFSQNTKTITFTARCTDSSYIQLSSVKVENLSKHWVQTLEWADTTLILNKVGIHEGNATAFSLAQNTPNPFNGQTSINLQLPQDEEASIALYDLSGKQYMYKTANLSAGNYTIQLSVGTPQMYLLQVQTAQGSRSIKMLAETGAGNFSMQIQAVEKHISIVRKADSQYEFTIGDRMQYTAICQIQGETQIRSMYDTITAKDTAIAFVFNPVNGYALLDIYYDSLGFPEGIVWHLSDTIAVINNKPYCKHGKILGLDEGGGMYSSYADGKFAYAFDSLDGESNTDSLMKLRYDTTLSFPERLQAAPWCRAKGADWYLPAILEVLEFRVYRDTINYILRDVAGWSPFRGAKPEDLAIGIWSSTEVDNAATEPRKRKAYYSSFGRLYDIGINDFGKYHDYYGSIMIGETYREICVRAVKKF